MEEDYRLKCLQEKEIISKFLKKNRDKTEQSYDEVLNVLIAVISFHHLLPEK